MSRSLIAHVTFSAVISAMMSGLVCAAVTYKMAGLGAAFMHVWVGGWMFAWPFAFGVLVVMGPLVRFGAYRLCGCEASVMLPKCENAR